MPLIECVPNLSEGRRLDVVDALAGAVSSVDGVHLLDRTSDPSHHRSVLTFAGEPSTIEEAVIALARTAVSLIDLGQHQGVHPRVGALDVVPFVPLRDASMEACVALARRAGQQIASELHVPVFLYQEAASRDERRRLERVRSGGLEGLAARMAGVAAWRPDYGPPSPHLTAGVTVVGARRVLVAWNLDLESGDVSVARTIAREIRESGGGYPGLKAMGVALAHRGIAQVSMNLTDYERTPMSIVFAHVVEAARRLGTRVAGSEIIGLVPRAALEAARRDAPGLWTCHAHQILEDRLEACGL